MFDIFHFLSRQTQQGVPVAEINSAYAGSDDGYDYDGETKVIMVNQEDLAKYDDRQLIEVVYEEVGQNTM